MKKIFILFIITSLLTGITLQAQNVTVDSMQVRHLKEVVVKGNKVPFLLEQNPGAVSIVKKTTLSTMPRSLAVNEALRLVPGVRIDNQHNSEKVHISIRGQGILTERGIRGIGIMLDGIPVNDPSGFAPDLYDVDWATVKNIEVLRGPSASLYGGSGAAGIVNITTENGGSKPLSGSFSQTVGSHSFYKSFIQLGGKQDKMDYRLSFSGSGGRGQRDHQGFRGNILYEKINFYPSDKIKLTQILSCSGYFQQNPEGLSFNQLDDPTRANPDAIPFNEYQKTNRITLGLLGKFTINSHHDIQLTSWLRPWRYKETSNKAAEYRNYNSPGVTLQYNLHLPYQQVKNNISIGVDLKWQDIGMYKLKSASDPLRKDNMDETNIETDTLLANQIITQRSTGIYALYQLKAGKFNLLGSLRYDKMFNQLTNKMIGKDTATTAKNFHQVSPRLGISYDFSAMISGYMNWSYGYMPPSTEELANNPVTYSGFNTHLVPATAQSLEAGIRGFAGDKFNYELTGFIMFTKNDFFRFKQSGRGNQEVFYGNAGNSKRLGIESRFSWHPFDRWEINAAYTWSDFRYTSATIDPIYTDTTYVLTTPPAPGQWLPNSPRNQLYAETIYTINKNFRINLAVESQSKWAVYTDAKAYNGEMDPDIYHNWQKGFTLLHAGITYQWHINKIHGTCYIYMRNLLNTEYMAFTEPDPDGNAYHPGPGREIFATLKFGF